MVAFKVEMPQVGESVTEAIIGKWLVAPGDVVRKYDPLVEVVTDKVNMEVTATADGTITKLIADEGATIAMGSIIAEMEVADDVVISTEDSPDSTDMQQGDRAGRIGTMVTGANVGPTGGEFRDTSLETGAAAGGQTAGEQRPGVRILPRDASGRKAVYSPVVLRLARRHSIDLARLSGTGQGGRVTKRDVERYLEQQPVQHADDTTHDAGAADRLPLGDQLTQPSPVRTMIAERMARSVREIPHAWAAIEVDMTHVVRYREAQIQAVESATKSRLTYLPISVLVVARALRRHPRLNASWTADGVVLRGRVNIGIAVASENGLFVPVLKDADTMGLNRAVQESRRLIEAGRGNTLSIDDVSDGTFTLNNTGAFGGMLGGAIINYPQAAILNTESIVKRPVVVEHPDGSDSIAIRPMMNLCLSFDHRIIDGAEAMAFLNYVKSRFESATFAETVESR